MPTIEQARAWYAEADPVHDFDHILRVLALAERIGEAEGADLEILRAATLLHDVAGSAPAGNASRGGVSRGTASPRGAPGAREKRRDHHHASATFARAVLREEGWPEAQIEAVLHCIRAHRFRDQREPPATLEAQILFDADKLDVLGAIGAARTVGYAVLDGQPIYARPSERFRATGEKEAGEPHSACHEFVFKLSKVKDRMHTRTAKALAEARHAYLEGFFEQLGAEVRGER